MDVNEEDCSRAPPPSPRPPPSEYFEPEEILSQPPPSPRPPPSEYFEPEEILSQPPPSPRPAPLEDFEHEEIPSKPPPTPRLSRRQLHNVVNRGGNVHNESSHDESSHCRLSRGKSSHGESSTSPNRPPSHLSESRLFQYINQSFSESRPSLASNLSNPYHKSSNMRESSEEDEEQAQVRKILYHDEDENMPDTAAQDANANANAKAKAAKDAEAAEDADAEAETGSHESPGLSSFSSTRRTPPVYPTPTDYDVIPDIKDESIAELEGIAKIIVSAQGKLPLMGDMDKFEILMTISHWGELLRHYCNITTHIPPPIHRNPKFHAPRYDDATYALTRTAIKGAFEAHRKIANHLTEIIASEEIIPDLGVILKDLEKENEKHWDFIVQAWESDKGNEVTGSSWLYGLVDWNQGPDNPIPIGWAGGRRVGQPEK